MYCLLSSIPRRFRRYYPLYLKTELPRSAYGSECPVLLADLARRLVAAAVFLATGWGTRIYVCSFRWPRNSLFRSLRLAAQSLGSGSATVFPTDVGAGIAGTCRNRSAVTSIPISARRLGFTATSARSARAGADPGSALIAQRSIRHRWHRSSA